jgi:hypothetical protein
LGRTFAGVVRLPATIRAGLPRGWPVGVYKPNAKQDPHRGFPSKSKPCWAKWRC